MADAALSLALETLGSLLVDEGKFVFSVGDEVEEVQRELNTMHSFLKDADKRPDRYDSEIVRNWVSELKDLAYSAENVLEKYDIKVASKRERKGLRNKVKRYGCILGEFVRVRHVGKEILAIRSRMANLTERLEAILAASSSSAADDNQQKWLIRQTYAHQVEPHFVGMEEDIEMLVSLAMDGGRSYRVISICGMGGLGKTTLARKIYQHEDVKACFEARAWVCVTQQFQFKTVLQQILKQLIPDEKEEIMEMDDRELVVEIHRVQIEKKCLVVIDDIWQTDHWDILSAAFPISEANCKVLMTTRNEKIAAEEHVYKLKFLTEDQGWELLSKIALPEDCVQVVSTELEELEKIGREIIHKCGCLPLAISVMGGVLRDKQNLGEWKKVNDNFDTYVQYGEGTNKERRVAQVLDLSYEVLPYYLKPCFLYLGCYAEDEEIDARKLCLQWISEGMIDNETQGREEILDDVAERYLSELASRCLVQVKLIEFPSTYERFESCHLHDLIRELCLSKAKEEGFLEVMDFDYPKSYGSSVVKTCRLAIHYQGDVGDDFNQPENVKSFANLRCLLVNNKLEDSHSVYGDGYYHLVSNLDKFSTLKILILAHCDLSNGVVPSDIGNKLIHLKYLGMRDCILDELPSSVSNLQRLQTLELELVEGETKLPNVIYKLKRLRHLFLKYKKSVKEEIRGPRLRLDGLDELETFKLFDTLYYHVTDIPKLKSLRRFKAYIFERYTLAVIANYISSSENNLRETILIIEACDLTSEGDEIILSKLFASPSLIRLKMNAQIGRFPVFETHQLCPNLVDVALSSCEFEENPMGILERLPMLQRLKMKFSFWASKLVCRTYGFPQLRYLFISFLPNLKEWVVEKDAAPKLSTIIIDNCKNLEMIPDGLRFITTLHNLQIYSMPQEFMDRVQNQQGQDYDKVCHVSSIVYGSFYFDSDTDNDPDCDGCW